MELILMRHPQVDAPPGTCYGQLDLALQQPITPDPEALIALLRSRHAHIEQVVCSPLQRTRLLAERVAQAFAAPLRLDPRWMELSFGDWEGRPWSAIPRHESEAWTADVERRAPPGGESLATLRERVHAAMDELAQHRPSCAVVVAHAGPMRVALARAHGLGTELPWDTELPFGATVRLRAHAEPAGWRWEALT